jgi:hypothetical protein
VQKGGGEAYIRLRVPKYMNTANGVTSIAKEFSMCIPQVGEMAEVLCGDKTPAVIGIGERCLEMGRGFFWPPFAERPFFVKPAGSRITVEAEGNILYLAGREVDNACPAEGTDGPDTEAENDEDMGNMPRDPTTGRVIWETPPRALSSRQRNDSVESGGDVVQDGIPASDERPPMTMREMYPRVDDHGMSPSVVALPRIPAFLHRANATGWDVSLDIDDPNATPDKRKRSIPIVRATGYRRTNTALIAITSLITAVQQLLSRTTRRRRTRSSIDYLLAL